MLTPLRRHYHERANKRLGHWSGVWGSGYEWGNNPGTGKYWKTALHQARRRYWREKLNGARHPHYPFYLESTVNWRAT